MMVISLEFLNRKIYEIKKEPISFNNIKFLLTQAMYLFWII